MKVTEHGTIRFAGVPKVFYMALCAQCRVDMPFGDAGTRAPWAESHRTTGHTVTFAVDVRPDFDS